MKPGIKWTLIAGTVAFIGAPSVGFAMTVLGVLTTFNTLSRQGISDPNVLAGHISTALTATVAGFVISTLGFIAIVIALIVHFTSSQQEKNGGLGSRMP